MGARVLVGIISDTHGLVRDSALDAFARCSHILHAGDIGKAAVIARLNSVAPVVAIRGNVDQGSWAQPYPETRLLDYGGYRFFLIHDRNTLHLDLEAARVDIVVSGHSHQPRTERTGGCSLSTRGARDRGASSCQLVSLRLNCPPAEPENDWSSFRIRAMPKPSGAKG